MKTVYLIGTGTNGTSALTAEAADAVKHADLLIGAKRMLMPYTDSGRECVCLYQPQQIADLLHSRAFQSTAILLSGDTGFYSGAKNLLPLLDDMQTTILPGISALSAFCAKCGLSYEQMKCVSLHGMHANIAIHAATNPYCFFLLGGETSAAHVCRQLCSYGLNLTVHIGTDLGYAQEQILHGNAAGFTDLPAKTLSVLVTENPAYCRSLPAAIPDHRFIRSTIPMTKAEIRCIAVASLQIPHDGICWDIGCGTGSVSVEAAFRCPDGQVFAFDRNPDAAALTLQNAKQFSCDNVQSACGNCPEILHDAPPPDAVFIGGSGGRLAEIFAAVSEKNPSAMIALTAVSLETLAEAEALFAKYTAEPRTVQIAVTGTRKAGSHTMFQAQNPVFLITGRMLCAEL